MLYKNNNCKYRLTFAEGHWGTPGTVASAGEGGEAVRLHNISRLACESDVLYDSEILTIPHSIGWHSGVTTVNHCGSKDTVTGGKLQRRQ